MGDFARELRRAEERFGVTVKDVPVARIVAAGRRVAAAEVAAEGAADRARYRLQQIEPDAHAAAARDYLALRGIRATEQMSGYSRIFQHVGAGSPLPLCCSR